MFSISDIKQEAYPAAYRRGKELYERGLVQEFSYDVYTEDGVPKAELIGRVKGTVEDHYDVRLVIDEEYAEVSESRCNCEAFCNYEGICKHCVAVALAYVNRRQAKDILNAKLGVSEKTEQKDIRTEKELKTDTSLKNLLNRYSMRAGSTYLLPENIYGKVELEPYFKMEYSYATVEFKIGMEQKYVLKNISAFLDTDENKNQQAQVPQNPMNKKQDPCLNYRVNLFVDNSNREGAPVIMDSNYSFNNIFGTIEYENYYGSLKTDHTMLKPGLLQQANGGYIVFQAKDLLANPACYENLKKALRVKKVGIENVSEQRSSMVLVSLKPEPIPLDLKVILIGNDSIYQTLLAMDSDFRKLFKIKVEFEEEAPRNTENMNKLARFVKSYCSQENLLPLDRDAMAKVVEYASKLADSKDKLSTRFNDLAQIIAESATWAKLAHSKVITGKFIDKALEERIERVKKYDSRYMEMIKENTLLIDTSGFKVGQINGLTIMNVGDYTFGKPVKITANTYTGKSGVVNIEREVALSGSSHSKGVLILSSYIGEMFAQSIPLSLTASVCFEQLYNGVDGDSASSTELYAILSSLSGMPINQSIAVTGSVNQKGEIQPIGGVNDKIEGFFQVCKMRGLDGSHGVIIPKQNVMNLNLSDEVISAVKEKKFHIYAITTIEEGIEILTGVPAGKKDSNGSFPAGSINYLAFEKLKKFARLVTEQRGWSW